MSEAKIVEGLKEAIAGNLERVTIGGETWIRSEKRTAKVLLDSGMSRNKILANYWRAIGFHGSERLALHDHH